MISRGVHDAKRCRVEHNLIGLSVEEVIAGIVTVVPAQKGECYFEMHSKTKTGIVICMIIHIVVGKVCITEYNFSHGTHPKANLSCKPSLGPRAALVGLADRGLSLSFMEALLADPLQYVNNYWHVLLLSAVLIPHSQNKHQIIF